MRPLQNWKQRDERKNREKEEVERESMSEFDIVRWRFETLEKWGFDLGVLDLEIEKERNCVLH